MDFYSGILATLKHKWSECKTVILVYIWSVTITWNPSASLVCTVWGIPFTELDQLIFLFKSLNELFTAQFLHKLQYKKDDWTLVLLYIPSTLPSFFVGHKDYETMWANISQCKPTYTRAMSKLTWNSILTHQMQTAILLLPSRLVQGTPVSPDYKV